MPRNVSEASAIARPNVARHGHRRRDAIPLGRDIIHSVKNPLPRFTCALDVYGGDFFAVSRSEWDPETLLEQRYDVQKAMRMFEEANSRIARARD
jgi:hypothetical protein